MVKNLDKNKPYLMFMGLRNEESSKRADYKDEWKILNGENQLAGDTSDKNVDGT